VLEQPQQNKATQLFGQTVVATTPPATIQPLVGYNYRHVFSSPYWREEFAKFLNVIFLQLDEEKFFALIDDIMRNSSSDEEIYDELARRIGEAKPGRLATFRLMMRSLSELKDAISDQIAKALGPQNKVEGYVEIGHSGRYVKPLKAKLDLKGPVYAINDMERMGDYVEGGIPRPYNKFVTMGNYEPIDESQIPSSSVELVSCCIGLHHAPEEKLQEFVQSIHRVLKPGGSFVLMDHDVTSKGLYSLVSVVHSVYNAAMGVSKAEEQAEVRNFQSLDYWKALLAKHGFRAVSAPQIREGDPTLNSLVRFIKIPTKDEEQLMSAKEQLPEDYMRKGYQTYLTTTEWHSVDISKEYGQFVEHTPFYQFPFFSHIGLFWKVFGTSMSP